MTDRRRFLQNAVASALAMGLSGCDWVSEKSEGERVLSQAEGLTRHAQGLLSPATRLAQEFTVADISAVFKANGTTMPDTMTYQTLMANGFADYRLEVGGLVMRPKSWSLSELKQMRQRTQITRHDCVEGWSAIGQWTGVPLAEILAEVVPTHGARFAVFHCFDTWDDGIFYYESIDLDEAVHPQTILAYEFNGETLPVPHGAPLRLRVERQLGYKQAKYIQRIEIVDSFAAIHGGKGGYWEDNGYDWYAGI